MRRDGGVVMSGKTRTFKLRIPRLVVNYLLYLNLLIILMLFFSSLGLNFFLRPKAYPATSSKNRKESTGGAGILDLWEMDTNRARRILEQGIPMIKKRNNP